MSMLAEPRRRQKFSLNPRGLEWANVLATGYLDEDKIGQKMMEKMGWSKGRGLGAKEDGNREHITLSFKNDTKGVGCTKQQADNWLSHQDDFAAILQQLNSTHKSTDTTGNQSVSMTSNDAGVINLEERSKKSRSRVHYQKFTKGKDLSLCRPVDFECIFGRRNDGKASVGCQKQTSITSDQDQKEPVLSTPTDKASTDQIADHSFGVITVTSATNINDYFAKKMATFRLTGSTSAPNLLVANKQAITEENWGPQDDVSDHSDAGITFSVNMKSEKRKKNNKNTDLETVTGLEKVNHQQEYERAYEAVDSSNQLAEIHKSYDNKKKKKREHQVQDVVSSECDLFQIKDTEGSKKKKLKKSRITGEENLDGVTLKKIKKEKIKAFECIEESKANEDSLIKENKKVLRYNDTAVVKEKNKKPKDYNIVSEQKICGNVRVDDATIKNQKQADVHINDEIKELAVCDVVVTEKKKRHRSKQSQVDEHEYIPTSSNDAKAGLQPEIDQLQHKDVDASVKKLKRKKKSSHDMDLSSIAVPVLLVEECPTDHPTTEVNLRKLKSHRKHKRSSL